LKKKDELNRILNITELKKKIAEVKQDKSLDKDKNRQSRELKAEIEDLIDNQDAIIEQYKMTLEKNLT
jgi:hypothetical protein